MTWYEDEVRALEGRCAQGLLLKNVNTFYGSSSIRLWDSLSSDFADHKVANLGFGGSTLEACVHFFERLILPCKPASLFLYAGDNDLGDGKPAQQVIAYLESFISKIDKSFHNIPFAFISIKSSPAREYLQKAIEEVNSYAELRLQTRQHSTFIDVHSRMLDEKGKPVKKYFAEDGLHLSEDGYRLWAKIVREDGQQVLS